ncbi:predicted protein [Postia placenta Mad-698-R]|nr:predicted protein [Postia placenta Mad-698-R]
MSSYRPTRSVVPLSGVYLVLWLDPVKMVQHFDHPNLQAAARQLSPGKYVAYVAVNTDFPIFDRPWYRCLVRFVGLGMPQDQPEQFVTPDISFQPSKPFPFSNCYLHTWVYATVRFPFQSVDYGDAWEISVVDMEEHRCYMNEDQRKRNILIEQASPPANPANIELVPSAPGSIVEVTSDTVVDANGVVKVEDWLKTTDHSQEPLEELAADNDISSEVSGDDTPDSLPDDDVSPSTPYSDDDANSMDTVDLLFESLFFPDFFHIDVDVIPLVDFSFDLTEVKEVPDPRGFLEEVEAMADLLWLITRRRIAGTEVSDPTKSTIPYPRLIRAPGCRSPSIATPFSFFHALLEPAGQPDYGWLRALSLVPLARLWLRASSRVRGVLLCTRLSHLQLARSDYPHLSCRYRASGKSLTGALLERFRPTRSESMVDFGLKCRFESDSQMGTS